MQKIKDYIYYNRKEIILILIFITIFIFYIFFTKNNNSEEDVVEYYELSDNKENEVVKNEIIIVDIKGEVNTPGTYELSENERVIDAINRAGGLTEQADTSRINLSEKIYDEMIISIPNKESIDSKEEIEKDIINSNIGLKISINTASVEELMTIKGIGLTKAKSIVEYRNKYGKFKSIEEITNVSGIGNATFEKIKDYIKV